MRIIFHIGMPKCGSTSIQNQLASDAPELAANHRIYYGFEGGKFQNHFELAMLIKQYNDLPALISTLGKMLDSAAMAGCDTVCISSENLFFLLDNEEKIAFLERGLEALGIYADQICYVLVYRKIENFIKSLVKQLLANGFSVEAFKGNLVDYYLKLIHRFFLMQGQRIAISLDRAKQHGGLIEVFYQQVLGIAATKKDRLDNTWGDRGYTSVLISGQVVGLHALNQNLLPNEVAADNFRAEIQGKIDELVKSDAAGTFFAETDQIYEQELQKLIASGIACLDGEMTFLLNALNQQSLINLALGDASTFLVATSKIDDVLPGALVAPGNVAPIAFPNALEDTTQSLSVDTMPPGQIPATELNVETRYGLMQVFDEDLISDFLVCYGEWSYLETSFLVPLLPEGARVFDIGAFLGTFSLAIAQAKPGFILAVEPNPQTFANLSVNLAHNLALPYALENCAVASRPGQLCGQCAEEGNLGAFSIDLTASAPFHQLSMPVDCKNLLGLREKHGAYDFLKLDVEGCETDVLLSDLDWIMAHQPMIWAECNESVKSFDLLALLLSLDYDVIFYRYPAFNPDNIRGERRRIFPVAFEAGLLALKPGQSVTVPAHALAAGASCEKIESASALRRALWLTPRWGKAEWANYSNTELLAVCSRLALNTGLDNFLAGEFVSGNKRKTPDHAFFGEIEMKLKQKSFFGLQVHKSSDFESWMTADVAAMNGEQLLDAALHLDGAAQFNVLQGADEASVLQRQRVLALLDHWMSQEAQVPDWVMEYHSKQQREAGMACIRIAQKYQGNNDAKSARFWHTAYEMLSQFKKSAGSNGNWVDANLLVCAREGGFAFDRVAANYKQVQKDDARALQAWQQGLYLIRALLANHSGLPTWVYDNYKGQLLEAGVACDRLASKIEDRASRERAQTYQTGALLLNELCQHFPGQPDWISDSLVRQLREGGVAWDLIAESCRKPEPAQATQYWTNSAQLLTLLFAQAGEHAPWLRTYHQKSLLEAGIGFGRLGLAIKDSDHQAASSYLLKGIELLEQLSYSYPDQPDWVLENLALQLLECGLACDRAAEALDSGSAPVHAHYRSHGARVLASLLALKPAQPEWVRHYYEKQLREGAFAYARLTTQQKEGDPVQFSEYLQSGLALFERLLCDFPKQDAKVIAQYQRLIDERDASNSRHSEALAKELVVRYDFANIRGDLFGLVRLSFNLIAGSGFSSALFVNVSAEDGSKAVKRIDIDDETTASTWIGIHTHLLDNGPNSFDASILDAQGRVLWQEEIHCNVSNVNHLAQQVRQSLQQKKVGLFVSGLCDTSAYDYADPSLIPWFDRPDAMQILEGWRSSGEISEDLYQRFSMFVSDGYIVLEDLIDEGLVAQINSEIDDLIAKGYQGFEKGSSQRLTLLHKVYPGIRALLFDQRYLAVVNKLFRATAEPCQSLCYVNGSQQDAHQDTIHLTPFPAGYMCGVWIALEDIQPDSGELEVYPKSHRLPRRYMHDVGCAKVKDDWREFGDKVVKLWDQDLHQQQFEKIIYRPKKGTVLIWHENLMHAGGVRKNLELTRRSIVFHCFAEGVLNFYDSTGEVGMIEKPETVDLAKE